jgi:DNA-binding transcriptional ArsR family regulator
LGNPVAFLIVRLLKDHGDMTPSEIGRSVGRSVSAISHVLAKLRLAEVVRYQTDGRLARYQLKHPREIRRILKDLSEFIDSTSPHRD